MRIDWRRIVIVTGGVLVAGLAACESAPPVVDAGVALQHATLGDGSQIGFVDEPIEAPEEPPQEMFDAVPMSGEFSPPSIAARLGIALSEVYTGSARKAAKLSVATGETKTFSSVRTLRSSLLTDAEAKAIQPKLNDGSKTGRRDFENQNVRVTAWIYAAKKSDDDNDYHLVIGTNPSNATRKLMTVEISGISDEFGHASELMEARRQWKETMGSALPGEGSYRKYQPPIKVRVEGSVFYDWTHRNHIGGNSEPGPKGFKPGTAWEIHPVTGIERLN